MIRIDLQANAVSALYGQHVHPHHALQHRDARLGSNLPVGRKAIVGSDQQDSSHISQHRTGGVEPQ